MISGVQFADVRREPGRQDAQEDGESRRLRSDREERGDRRRRSLICVRRPLVERNDGDLEAESRRARMPSPREQTGYGARRRNADVMPEMFVWPVIP